MPVSPGQALTHAQVVTTFMRVPRVPGVVRPRHPFRDHVAAGAFLGAVVAGESCR